MLGELLVRPALDLAELMRSGEVRARELIEAAFRRLEERESHINAFSFVDADRALSEAGRIFPGDPRPFAGVPIAIKDGTPQAGLPMRIGSKLFRDYVADHDGAPIKRLKEAGFVPVGRTTMPEFGILPTTEPRLTGPTRNPWDLSRTPGGSSGGSAAAVAAGIAPLAHGGDGGGSLRIPAACCGLVGLKATRGRISAAPNTGDDLLSIQGVLTRTVADTTALLDVLSGYEPGDVTWAPPPARPFREALPPRGRLGHPRWDRAGRRDLREASLARGGALLARRGSKAVHSQRLGEKSRVHDHWRVQAGTERHGRQGGSRHCCDRLVHGGGRAATGWPGWWCRGCWPRTRRTRWPTGAPTAWPKAPIAFQRRHM